jgi:hypothetical protein
MGIRNITVIGSNDDLKKSLQVFATRLESVASTLYARSDLGNGCRAYPRIARSTAEQLLLLRRHLTENIEITAGVCRTVFEINVTCRYCLSSPERLKDFMTQRGTDEISIYKAIKRLPREGDFSQQTDVVDERIKHLRGILQRHNLPLKPDRPSLRGMAKVVGVESEYDCLYSLYSKYVHASAWFVLGERDQFDLPVFRKLMQVETQVYAGDTLARLENLESKREPSAAATASTSQ